MHSVLTLLKGRRVSIRETCRLCIRETCHLWTILLLLCRPLLPLASNDGESYTACTCTIYFRGCHSLNKIKNYLTRFNVAKFYVDFVDIRNLIRRNMSNFWPWNIQG
jgi:hypothetical protein